MSGRLGSASSDMHCLETYLLRTTVEHVDEGNDLRQELQKFWDVENVGPSTDCVTSKFEENIMHNGTRYIVKLPFKPDYELLPDQPRTQGILLPVSENGPGIGRSHDLKISSIWGVQ
jgi:hypothetical protein